MRARPARARRAPRVPARPPAANALSAGALSARPPHPPLTLCPSAPLAPQRAQRPTHQSTDITDTVHAQQQYAASAFLSGDDARAQETHREGSLAAAAAAEAAAAAAAAIEAAKVRKDPDCPSFHGAFATRAVGRVPVGGALSFADSQTRVELGPAPRVTEEYLRSLAAPAPSPSPPAAATGHGGGGGGGGADGPLADAPIDDDARPMSADAAALLASPLDSARRGGALAVPPLGTRQPQSSLLGSTEPPALPPPASRLSAKVPPTADGRLRPGGKVRAPTVSEMPASANPNLLNLLLEVPYKRGVHTVSVNQRYLNHEPTFDAAFELTPAAAAFGAVRSGCTYRYRLLLTNVSNLPQRFTVQRARVAKARVVYTPGVAAPGISVPLEVEVAEAGPAELHEILTIVTEREELSLLVTATVLPEDAPAASLTPHGPDSGVRMIANTIRDPALTKTLALTTRDLGAGTKRFAAPPRPDPETKLRPDINDPDDDDDDAEDIA